MDIAFCERQGFRHSIEKGSSLATEAFILNGAEEGTRTLTGFLPLPPQDSVSTNSTTPASYHLR